MAAGAMTGVGLPTCPACASAVGWIIDSPVSATDRVRLEVAGLMPLGLFAPEDGFEPLGRPTIVCAACGSVAVSEELRAAVLGAATTRATTH